MVNEQGDFALEKLSRSRITYLEYDNGELLEALNASESQHILQALTAIADTFDLTIYIGGVADDNQRSRLQKLGCQFMYGPAIGNTIETKAL